MSTDSAGSVRRNATASSCVSSKVLGEVTGPFLSPRAPRFHGRDAPARRLWTNNVRAETQRKPEGRLRIALILGWLPKCSPLAEAHCGPSVSPNGTSRAASVLITRAEDLRDSQGGQEDGRSASFLLFAAPAAGVRKDLERSFDGAGG